MKRVIATISTLVCFSGLLTAQVLSPQNIKNLLSETTGEIAEVLNVNSTIGNQWSDSYVGNFPHLGVGLTVGITGTGMTPTFKNILNQFGIYNAIPAQAGQILDQVGLPIPAAAATAKIGIPFLPMDIGVKYGIIPESLGAQLAGSGIELAYDNLGIGARYAVIKETEASIIPDVSVGFFWNSMHGNLKMKIADGQSVKYQTPNPSNPLIQDTWVMALTSPKLDLDWKSTTYDSTAQISKRILWIVTPYVGAGYTIGSSTMTSGIATQLQVTKNGVAVDKTSQFYKDLVAFLTKQGLPVPQDKGFYEVQTNTEPTLRVYGGVSLNILVMLDVQAIYIPATGKLGGSINARVQL